jgi:hypothetical protein
VAPDSVGEGVQGNGGRGCSGKRRLRVFRETAEEEAKTETGLWNQEEE